MKTNRQQALSAIKEQMMKTVKSTLATTSLLLGLAMASPAAAVQCGDTIGPNQTVGLDKSLDCDVYTGGLTVIGPAELYMNGYTIRCHDSEQIGYVPIGLIVQGQRAHVDGYGEGAADYGLVDGCLYGVWMIGEGHHTVQRVMVERSRTYGFLVESGENTLQQNWAAHGEYGFVTGRKSNNNILYYNVADTNDKDGFLIRGNKHQLLRNMADFNESDGFSIYGVGHELTENGAGSNIFDGFDLQEREAKQVTLHGNLAHNNGDAGFEISGQEHELTQNRAEINRADGIEVHDANKVVLRYNEATYNNQGNFPGTFDLKDQKPNCGTNTWQNNTFGTASNPCIQ